MGNILKKIRKNGLKHFPAHPYNASVIVYVLGEDKALMKVFPDHPTDYESANGRVCWMTVDGYNIVTLGLRPDLSDLFATMAHECYHAMNAVYRWSGAEHDPDNDEPAAYFLGYLMRNTATLFGELTSGGQNG